MRKVVILNYLLLVGARKTANWIQVLLLERINPVGLKNHERNRKKAGRKQEVASFNFLLLPCFLSVLHPNGEPV